MCFSWRVCTQVLSGARSITRARVCVNHSKITAKHTHDIIIINKVFLRHIGDGVINQRTSKIITHVYTAILFIIIIFIFTLYYYNIKLCICLIHQNSWRFILMYRDIIKFTIIIPD